ncbi:hypothetical protein ES702_05973 [subsurface metagenome]
MTKKKAKEEFVKIKEGLEAEPKPKRERRTKAEMEAERDTLAQEPNPLLIPVLKMPFNLWATSQKIEELKLDDKEAFKLALPVTQLVEYYLPKIPAIGYVWVSLVLAIYGITQPRIKKIQKVRIERAEKKPKPEEQK